MLLEAVWLREEMPLSFGKRRLGGFIEIENFKVQITVTDG